MVLDTEGLIGADGDKDTKEMQFRCRKTSNSTLLIRFRTISGSGTKTNLMPTASKAFVLCLSFMLGWFGMAGFGRAQTEQFGLRNKGNTLDTAH